MACAFVLTGCGSGRSEEEKIPAENPKEESVTEESATEEPAVPEFESGSSSTEMDQENSAESVEMEPEITEADWSDYFGGLNGTAVIYDPSASQYTIYNPDLAVTRSSPCSTFKIISSLTGLESGIIDPENSTRTWSGEIFWNEDWNRDIDFREAFRTSCVWYYRQAIDDIGAERMQEELDKLQYGNCDISDWEGRLNTNNSNRALTGFWIESSLKISSKEQTEVMERIFPSMEKQGWEKQMVLLWTRGLRALRKARREIFIFVCALEGQTAWRCPVHWQKR